MTDDFQEFHQRIKDINNDPDLKPYLGKPDERTLEDLVEGYQRGLSDALRVEQEIDALLAEEELIAAEVPGYRVRRLTELHQVYTAEIKHHYPLHPGGT